MYHAPIKNNECQGHTLVTMDVNVILQRQWMLRSFCKDKGCQGHGMSRSLCKGNGCQGYSVDSGLQGHSIKTMQVMIIL